MLLERTLGRAWRLMRGNVGVEAGHADDHRFGSGTREPKVGESVVRLRVGTETMSIVFYPHSLHTRQHMRL